MLAGVPFLDGSASPLVFGSLQLFASSGASHGDTFFFRCEIFFLDALKFKKSAKIKVKTARK